MFDPKSRYYTLETATTTDENGRTVAYVKRRFLPQGSTMNTLADVTVKQGERLDLITARTLGDPEQFWRVADANNAMDPFDLVEVTGAVIRVPVPEL